MCNCAHASAVNYKGFVELAATTIDIVISKLEFHLIPSDDDELGSLALPLQKLRYATILCNYHRDLKFQLNLHEVVIYTIAIVPGC